MQDKLGFGGAQHIEFSHLLIDCYAWLAYLTLWHICGYFCIYALTLSLMIALSLWLRYAYVDPLVGGRGRRKILFFLGEWVRLEVMERTGSSGRFEGEKSGKGKKRGQHRFFSERGIKRSGVKERKRGIKRRGERKRGGRRKRIFFLGGTLFLRAFWGCR